MPGVRLHALRIAWHVAQGAPDPARLLFAGFCSDDDRGGPAEIAIVVEPRRAPVDAARFRQTFHHVALRGLERDGEFLLVSPGADTRIESSGRGITMRIDADADVHIAAKVDLFIALTIALRRRGLFHVHAGAVARADGTRILVAGDSGAGKSTVTLGLLQPGAEYLGDDAVFLVREHDSVSVVAFPLAFRLAETSLAGLPFLAERVMGRREVDEKYEVAYEALDETGAHAIFSMGAPQVLLFPNVTGEASTRSAPLTEADAFGALLHASAFAMVDGMPAAREHIAVLGDVVRGARAYALDLGRDWLTSGARVPAFAACIG